MVEYHIKIYKTIFKILFRHQGAKTLSCTKNKILLINALRTLASWCLGGKRSFH